MPAGRRPFGSTAVGGFYVHHVGINIPLSYANVQINGQCRADDEVSPRSTMRRP